MEAKTRVIIAGGGTAGWMTAAALSKLLGKTLDITLVESDEIGTVGVGEATIPTLHIFHSLLGIKESEVMAATNATFKLGIAFEHWRDLNQHYLHSFGFLGQDCWAAQFHHFWVKGRQRGITRDIGDYCVEHLAAREGRFAVYPNQEQRNHAYHLDATAYAKFLRVLAERYGVRRVEGKITDVRLREDNNFIESIHLASGEILQGDLFVDCTGFRGLLIEEALHTGYDDWTHYLPCDRAIAVQTESDNSLVPYTRSIAHEAGWQWRIPLQTRTGNGMVYCSRYWTEDQAREVLVKNLEGKMINEPRVIPFRTGTRRLHWNKNCVAIGLSSGFIEPLESTSIHLIQRSIIKLMLLFPARDIQQSDLDEFNRQTREELEHIRDFIVLHYKQTVRGDTKFWRHCRAMPIPDTLRHRMALFQESGRIYRYDKDLFQEASWVQVMMGQGIMPSSWHPIVDLMSEDELKRFLENIRLRVQKTVAEFPVHKAFIEKYCPSVKNASLNGAVATNEPGSQNISEFNKNFQCAIERIGAAKVPVAVVDDFCVDGGESLRNWAKKLKFEGDTATYYPGLRVALPDGYVNELLKLLLPYFYKLYNLPVELKPRVTQACYSLVTQPPSSLQAVQRIPHFDKTSPYTFAILHYLALGEHGDTAFFRHNPTGLERIFELDRKSYMEAAKSYAGKRAAVGNSYINEGSEEFSLYHRVKYKTNRLVFYPGNLLHSALIDADRDISDNVDTGRLTANIFLDFE